LAAKGSPLEAHPPSKVTLPGWLEWASRVFFLNLLRLKYCALKMLRIDLTHVAADQQGIPIPFRPVR
jgi:hypothetical protein